MSHSSFDDLYKMDHVTCGATFYVWSKDWPPQLVICPKCGTKLRLLSYDPATNRLRFRIL